MLSLGRRFVTAHAAAATRGLQTFADTPRIVLAGMPVGAFQMNQYVIACARTKEAAIIDSGGDPAPFLSFCEKRGFQVTKLLQTHAHIDHIGHLAETKQALPHAPIFLHPDDLVWYNNVAQQSAMFGMKITEPPAPDEKLKDGDVISVGDLRLEVMHTPGHCPGHVVFYCPEECGYLVAGDLIFHGSVGRTDFPYSEPAKMTESLKRVMKLRNSVRVFSGHMQDTTVGNERKFNPFVAGFPGGDDEQPSARL